MRIDPPPSVPVAIETIPPATAAAEPPLDPPGVRSVSQGFRVTPPTSANYFQDREHDLDEIREKLPHTDLTDFEKNPDLNKLGDLFTVNAIINFLDSRLNAA